MNLKQAFDAFLTNEVNLNQTRIDLANATFDSLTNVLRGASDTKALFRSTSKQGSLRQGTIIKPRRGKTEFDVDMMLLCHVQAGWGPRDYLNAVASAFKADGRYKDKVDRIGKTRCVTLEYSGDFHVDVVPAIERDGRTWVMNRTTNSFEVTDGDGYAAWFAAQNVEAGAQLVRVTRLLKYLRDENEWEVKSILLTTMLGLRVQAGDSRSFASDTPRAFVTLTARLDQFLQGCVTVPTIANPALPSEHFVRHWNQEIFDRFKSEFHDVAIAIGTAYGLGEGNEATSQWQDIFGESFPSLGQTTALAARPTYALASVAHAQPVEAIPVAAVAISERVRITASLYNAAGTKFFRGIASGVGVRSGLAVKFKATTSAREPYEVYWQVVNTGGHAASKDGLRGTFFKGRNLESKATPKLINWERTEYTGRHWIECFIVRSGVCVARSDRFYLNITNPAFRS